MELEMTPLFSYFWLKWQILELFTEQRCEVRDSLGDKIMCSVGDMLVCNHLWIIQIEMV